MKLGIRRAIDGISFFFFFFIDKRVQISLTFFGNLKTGSCIVRNLDRSL